MKKLHYLTALLLALLSVVSVLACGNPRHGTDSEAFGTGKPAKTEETAEPAATATPVPETAAPTSVPETAAPTAMPSSVDGFDPETMTYSDEFVSFSVPEELVYAFDATGTLGNTDSIDYYLIFSPSSETSSPNLSYYYALGPAPDEKDIFACMTEEELNELLRDQYAAMLGCSVSITNIDFREISDAKCKGIECEYSISTNTYATLNQRVFSVITHENVAITIVYTWLASGPFFFRDSAASITIR